MKIYAHRGFSHRFPEATREAYEGAVKAGADGFECDVRLSKEKVLVCFHDRTTKRVAGVKKVVSGTTVDELKSIAKVITFEELLDLAIKEKKDILVETKHPVIQGALVEKVLLELLQRRSHEISATGIQITIISFSYLAIMRLKKNYPDVAKVIKYSFAAIFNRSKKVAVNIEILRKHPGLLRKMKAETIYAWTVNSREDLNWIKKREIDGVITDRVARARRVLAS
jgi:glycerophosphoryl diester phosphodiesterase